MKVIYIFFVLFFCFFLLNKYKIILYEFMFSSSKSIFQYTTTRTNIFLPVWASFLCFNSDSILDLGLDFDYTENNLTHWMVKLFYEFWTKPFHCVFKVCLQEAWMSVSVVCNNPHIKMLPSVSWYFKHNKQLVSNSLMNMY